MSEKEKFLYKAATVGMGLVVAVAGAAVGKYLSAEAGLTLGLMGAAICGYAIKHFADA